MARRIVFIRLVSETRWNEHGSRGWDG